MPHTINHKKRYNARKLKGAGLKDLFSKVKNTVSNVVGKIASIPTNIINNILPEQQKYTRKAKTMIDRYGGFKIEHLFVERQEVNSAVMKLASVLTVGEMNNAMQKSGVDKFYHLNLKAIITSALGTPLHILIEKNDTINIDLWKQRANVETMEIDLLGKVLTITEMLTKTRLAIGNEKFFLYRALEGKNCGDFCEDVVKSILACPSSFFISNYRGDSIITFEDALNAIYGSMKI